MSNLIGKSTVERVIEKLRRTLLLTRWNRNLTNLTLETDAKSRWNLTSETDWNNSRYRQNLPEKKKDEERRTTPQICSDRESNKKEKTDWKFHRSRRIRNREVLVEKSPEMESLRVEKSPENRKNTWKDGNPRILRNVYLGQINEPQKFKLR